MQQEIRNLKLWLDAELSINHAYYWAILGVLIGGKFWFIAGLGIFINLVYAGRSARKIPNNYLEYRKLKT